MDSKSLRLLEFDKIKKMAEEYLISAVGQERLDNLPLYTDAEDIKTAQALTTEVRSLLTEANLSLRNLSDIRSTINQLRIKSVPSEESYGFLMQTLEVYRQAMRKIDQFAGEIPLTRALCSGERVPDAMLQELSRIIDPEGGILDDASPILRDLRRKLVRKEAEIRKRLDGYLQSPSLNTVLQEKLFTTRQGRYVLPVKSEYRQRLPGIIHDQSASGATLFIEPQAIAELTNDLRLLEQDERKEIDRILANLTDYCANFVPELMNLVEVMGVLDLKLALAYLSIAMKATEPELSTDGMINLINARHPLIPAKSVVPISVTFGQNIRALIITGPNTGGKTVSLKLIGLIQAMAQSGMHIPADVNSRVAVFDNILADLGDEQSIEQSLSTFSSHMVNIVRLLKLATDNSLVLLDELGAGTDPVEGAALAMAIIEELLEKRSTIVATTHYSELKLYAYNHPEIINGSVEFDVATLSPTYKLILGLPGKSNAFLISERLGLDKHIISRAEDFTGTDHRNIEELIKELERDRKEARERLAEAERLERSQRLLNEELRQRLSAVERDKKAAQREAAEEAKEEMQLLKQLLEEKIIELNQYFTATAQEEAEALEAVREARRALHAEEERLRQLSRELYDNPLDRRARETAGRKTTVKRELAVGDLVFHRGWQREGRIVEIKQNGEMQIQCGQLRMWTDPSHVEYREEKIVERQHVSVSKERRMVPFELDLRGMTILEAEDLIAKYLDDALLNNRTEVTIIHGKGTGALRKGVLAYLKNHPDVAETRMGGHSEGGLGVTVVKLKN